MIVDYFFKINFLPKTLLECLMVWIQIRTDSSVDIVNTDLHDNPLYANGLFLLIWDNKLGIVHCTYEGFQVMILKKILYFSVWRSFFTFANSVYPDEMLHYAAFHLGLHCLQKYSFRGFPKQRVKKGIGCSQIECWLSGLQFTNACHKSEHWNPGADCFFSLIWVCTVCLGGN